MGKGAVEMSDCFSETNRQKTLLSILNDMSLQVSFHFDSVTFLLSCLQMTSVRSSEEKLYVKVWF